MTNKHIVTSFDADLDKLRSLISEMGGLVESQLRGAIEILEKFDPEKAKKIIARDQKLDDLEAKLDQTAIQILALRQPFAEDLRIIVTALKISSNLERMGDYCKNVAKRMLNLETAKGLDNSKKSLAAMGKMLVPMVKEVLDCFIDSNIEQAVGVIEADRDVDRVYTSIFREFLTYMMEDTRNITPCTQLLFVAKNFERIGDHATNIAEQVHFMLVGHFPLDDRPKGDITDQISVPKKGK